MGGTGVVDRFLDIFSRYIDSGFGLLGGEVAFIATTLIVIDVTLAALFWSWGEQDDILARLVKKTLFVGIFAYIIGNWNSLARIVFESFAGLGLKASGTGFTAAELLQPGRVAQVGLDAAYPLLESISELLGFVSFFENFLQIVILLVAWAIVIIAFFILSIQLFITLIEFKLATLCGFVLIPFGLFGKTAFMAERVLGHVVSSGIKVLVLAVIVGIGSARIQARSWRYAFFGALGLSACLTAGIVWQGSQGSIIPWVVQVDKLGEAQAVAPAVRDFDPSDPQIAFHLARFIEQVRSIPDDPIIVRQNWLRAYDFVTDRGGLVLNDYARTNDPFALIGREQVGIDVTSVIRASPTSFRVAWVERRYRDGSLAETSRWTAILTITVQTPRTPDALRKNPLGIFVNAINWSKELGS